MSHANNARPQLGRRQRCSAGGCLEYALEVLVRRGDLAGRLSAGDRQHQYAESVPLQRRFGDQVGERVAKILSDNGVRFLGSTTVTAIDDTRVHLDTGATLDGDVVVSATRVRPDPHLAEAVGLDSEDGRIVVDEHMHTSARNVYAAGDVALAYNVTAGRRIRAEHWRDAAQQGLIAGLSAAGHPRHGTKCPDSLAP